MTELSDNARYLADLLIGTGWEFEDGVLRGEESEPDLDYDSADFLRIASAALELAGEETPFADYNRLGLQRRTFGRIFMSRVLKQGDSDPWIEVGDFKLTASKAIALAANLLHAAATARQWESEGKSDE